MLFYSRHKIFYFSTIFIVVTLPSLVQGSVSSTLNQHAERINNLVEKCGDVMSLMNSTSQSLGQLTANLKTALAGTKFAPSFAAKVSDIVGNSVNAIDDYKVVLKKVSEIDPSRPITDICSTNVNLLLDDYSAGKKLVDELRTQGLVSLDVNDTMNDAFCKISSDIKTTKDENNRIQNENTQLSDELAKQKNDMTSLKQENQDYTNSAQKSLESLDKIEKSLDGSSILTVDSLSVLGEIKANSPSNVDPCESVFLWNSGLLSLLHASNWTLNDINQVPVLIGKMADRFKDQSVKKILDALTNIS